MKGLILIALVAAVMYAGFESAKFSSAVRVVNHDRIERAVNY